MEKSPEARTGWPNDEQIDQQSGRCRKARAHILSENVEMRWSGPANRRTTNNASRAGEAALV
jgi:hypothetical protein